MKKYMPNPQDNNPEIQNLAELLPLSFA